MANLPRVKRTAVRVAPTHTSRQRIWASGSTLKIKAKSAVITIRERTRLNPCRTTSGNGNSVPNHLPTAAKTVLSTRDTSRRKAVPMTVANDIVSGDPTSSQKWDGAKDRPQEIDVGIQAFLTDSLQIKE